MKNETLKLFKIHLAEMKKQLLSLGKKKGVGRILGDSPFRRIPAVSKFQIITKPYNMVLEALKIKLRLPAHSMRELDKDQNRMNKYMEHVLKRIRKLVANGAYTKAWKIAKLNIKFSKSFRATAFNFVMKGWYYNMAQSEVFKLNRSVNKILYKEAANLDYKRVYIEKSNGKLRPLGVPSKEWRIALHLINGFFIEILKPQLLASQHAYIPGKGTMSAWKETIVKVKESKFIYETDLKGFFNEVSVWRILDILNRVKSSYSTWVYNLCQAIPKFPKNKKMDESKFDLPKNKNEGFYSKEVRNLLPKIYNIDEVISPKPLFEINYAQKYRDKLRNYESTTESFHGKVRDYFSWNLKEDNIVTNKYKTLKLNVRSNDLLTDNLRIPHLVEGKVIISNKKLMYSEPVGPAYEPNLLEGQHLKYLNYGLIPGGVPQGMPMSPFLSILAVKDYLAQVTSVNYADDQIFYSKTDFVVKDDPNLGIIHSSEKCSWIMRDGKWLQDGLKFLGFKLMKNWEFMSETRSGVKAGLNEYISLIYSDEGLKRLRKIKTYESLENYVEWLEKAESGKPQEVLENISKRNIFGFIMSCMQIDDWKNDHSIEDRNKAVRNHLAKLNRNSLTKRIPSNLDSSKSIPFLMAVITVTMGKKSNYPFSVHNHKPKHQKPEWLINYDSNMLKPDMDDNKLW
jgi:hypothetical protein